MTSLNKNNKGFTLIEILLSILIIVAIAFAGWYVAHSQNDKDTNLKTSSSQSNAASGTKQSRATSPSYDPEKTKYIKDFDLASISFKSALVNNFFEEAKASCLEAAKEAPDATDTNTYIVFKKMVRDEFATAQYCGSGGTSIFAKVSSEWKRIGSLAMAPACSLVDQYKISKEVSATCYQDDGSSRDVTYQ